MRSCSFRFLVLNYPVLALSGVYAGGGGGGGGALPHLKKKFRLEKTKPLVYYTELYIYFKDCYCKVRSSLKCTLPPKKLRMRLIVRVGNEVPKKTLKSSRFSRTTSARSS